MPAVLPETLSFADAFILDPAAQSDQQFRYLNHCRRVPVGPSIVLSFENRQTLAFRVRELERLSRYEPAETIRPALAWYGGLLPGPNRISAAVAVRQPGRRPSHELHRLAALVAAGRLTLRIGDCEVLGEVRPGRAGDRVLGPAFWVTFTFNAAARDAFLDFTRPATLSITASDDEWDSGPLAFEVRQSLVGDLG